MFETVEDVELRGAPSIPATHREALDELNRSLDVTISSLRITSGRELAVQLERDGERYTGQMTWMRTSLDRFKAVWGTELYHCWLADTPLQQLLKGPEQFIEELLEKALGESVKDEDRAIMLEHCSPMRVAARVWAWSQLEDAGVLEAWQPPSAAWRRLDELELAPDHIANVLTEQRNDADREARNSFEKADINGVISNLARRRACDELLERLG